MTTDAAVLTPATYPREPDTMPLCPACGHDGHSQLCITDRYGLTWWCGQCYQCSLEFQVHPITTEARRHFYGTGTYRQLCAQVTGEPWTDPAFLRRSQQQYAHAWKVTQASLLLPRTSGPWRWLDYGGSTGEVSRIWAGGRADVTVADYGDGAPTTPEDAIASGHDRPYDVVLCCQTFDHLPNPLEMARTFHAITRPGGSLFLDVAKQRHTAYKLDHETYWPTLACIVGCLERAGWRIRFVDAVTDHRHWALWGSR